MINKHNLWFITLLSLVLVLGVYYVTIPNSLLKEVKTKAVSKIKKKDTNTKDTKVTNVVEESSLVAMRVNLQEERQEEMNVLQEKLTQEELSKEEKNNIYEEIKYLNEIQGKEESLEKKIKEEFKLDCFIKIDNNNIQVVCVSSEHDTTLANNIMRIIQKEYQEKKNITVKFQKATSS